MWAFCLAWNSATSIHFGYELEIYLNHFLLNQNWKQCFGKMLTLRLNGNHAHLIILLLSTILLSIFFWCWPLSMLFLSIKHAIILCCRCPLNTSCRLWSYWFLPFWYFYCIFSLIKYSLIEIPPPTKKPQPFPLITCCQ